MTTKNFWKITKELEEFQKKLQIAQDLGEAEKARLKEWMEHSKQYYTEQIQELQARMVSEQASSQAEHDRVHNVVQFAKTLQQSYQKK